MHLHVGCSGWSYTAWVGPFYPRGLPQTKWLENYSKLFDYVEVDSSFYSIPSPIRTTKWSKVTPANFRFTTKMPKLITHDKVFYNVDRELELFYGAMTPLKDKLLCVLIQLPSSITYKSGTATFKNFMRIADPQFRYAIEVRHNSWFNDDFYEYLSAENVCLVWNQLDTIQAPPVLTTNFAYLRFIGDRSISEHDFGCIQKDRLAEMQYWAAELKRAKNTRMVKIGIVAANNHYAGFGPGTAGQFRKMLGLERQVQEEKQLTLSEFGIGSGSNSGSSGISDERVT